MKIIVKGYFNLQKAMDGRSQIHVEKATATIREVLDDLSDRFGKDLTELLYDSGTEEPASHIILLVNGRNYLSMPEKLDTELKDGDEIALFPPLAGG
jgi:molybdopterin synthase sulfur carrier subunit